MKNLVKLAIFGSIMVCNHLIAAEIDLDFDSTMNAPPAGLDSQGSAWSGGVISELENSKLRASGKNAYVISGASGRAVFGRPVNNVRFFFVHGDGIPAGTATAFNADGRVLATANSKAATSFGDSRNFVRFRTSEPISAIEFSGGAVDAVTADAFEVDYFGIQQQWVNNDLEEGNRQGLTFDYISTSDMLYVAWYSYTSVQTGPEFDDVGATDNRWLTAQLDISDIDQNTASGMIFASTGGVFDMPNTGNQQTMEVGTMTVEFQDCDLAMVSYDLPGAGLSNQFAVIPLEKRVNPDGFRCDPEAELPTVFEPDISQVDADVDVSVRAARDAERIALQFSWATNKNYAGLLHDIRALDETGEWNRPDANIDIDSPTKVNEDRVAVIFGVQNAGDLSTESANMGCFQSCHADMNGMPQNVEDTRHYVIPRDSANLDTYQADMWHWRGSRSGPMGYAEDTWVRAHEFGTGAQGRRRDETGPDGRLRENQGFDTEFSVTVDGQSMTVKLPDFVFDPALNSGFYFLNDGTRLITEETIGNLFSAQSITAMEAGELQHALITNGPRTNVVAVADLDAAARDEVAAQAVAGGIINRPFLNDDTTGTSDQHDIESDRGFNGGTWTVTMFRELNTGSEFDIDLSGIASQSYPMAFAVHDSNDGERSHQVSVPVTLGAGGDIEPVEVLDVEEVNWAAITPFTHRNFKPGDISYEWLNDQETGHPVTRTGACSSCHFRASADHGPGGAQAPGQCLTCHSNGERAAQLWEYAPLNLQD